MIHALAAAAGHSAAPAYQTPAWVQSGNNLAASGPATATISAATASNLLLAIAADGTINPAISGSGYTSLSAYSANSARFAASGKVAAGGETSEATTGVTTNESIFFIELSGTALAGAVAASVSPDSGSATNAVNTASISAQTPPGIAVAWVVTNGTTTSPGWTVGGFTLADGTRLHVGYQLVAAGVATPAGTFSWTGTTRRASGGVLWFPAKTI